MPRIEGLPDSLERSAKWCNRSPYEKQILGGFDLWEYAILGCYNADLAGKIKLRSDSLTRLAWPAMNPFDRTRFTLTWLIGETHWFNPATQKPTPLDELFNWVTEAKPDCYLEKSITGGKVDYTRANRASATYYLGKLAQHMSCMFIERRPFENSWGAAPKEKQKWMMKEVKWKNR